MKKMAVGIMSGTSLDGIDVVIASIEGTYTNTRVEIKAFKTYPLTDGIIKRIKEAMNDQTCHAALISSLNMELGYLFGDAAIRCCQEAGIPLEDIEYVASHGQTIWHINEDNNPYLRSSLQLGEGSAIASIMKTTVVSNFRCADIASGGQGAPLVPYVDYLLFSDQKISRSLHNLGGISNFTYLEKGCHEDDIIACDTGPANMMINRACQVLYHQPYDDGGKIAKSGQLIKPMFDELMAHPFLKEIPPKSTGREVFGDQLTDTFIERFQTCRYEDIIHTLTQFTAQSIVDAYKRFIIQKHPLDEIIFSGGGARNEYLLELIQEGLPAIKIKTLDDAGMDSQIKEALAFLILGHETLHHRPSNLINATGAKKHVILGQINYYR
jgi:anhydro-N-acetylmuramic acid kinase